jgi:hypothetical protein
MPPPDYLSGLIYGDGESCINALNGTPKGTVGFFKLYVRNPDMTPERAMMNANRNQVLAHAMLYMEDPSGIGVYVVMEDNARTGLKAQWRALYGHNALAGVLSDLSSITHIPVEQLKVSGPYDAYGVMM